MSNNDTKFLWNCWYAAGWEHEVAEAEKLERTFLGKPVVIFKGESGRYIALDNRCCHRGAPLGMGRIEGDCIRCMYHGLKFDPQGICVEIPGQDKIPASHKVRSYPIEERGNLLWIWMGDPALANTDDIIDYAPLSDPEWQGLPKQCYLHYDCNWMLIIDNLADFSHLAFVHTNTLGGSEAYAVETKQEIERLERGFQFERWHRESAPAPYHLKVNPDESPTVDRRNYVQMFVPGVFLMETAFGPVGWDQSADHSAVKQYRNCQYMTPETENTAHFFWDYLRNYRQDEEAVSISLRDSLLEGFWEDKVIIEAQQKLLELEDPFQPRGIAADSALAHFRKVWDELLEDQRVNHPPKQIEVTRSIL